MMTLRDTRVRRSSLLALFAVGAFLGVAGGAVAGGAAVTPGALYVGHPFPGDNFGLKVASNGKFASFVGSFVYTDPGCPSAPSGNEYLTKSNAPKVKISSNGGFTGTKTNGPYTDRISGRFAGAKASVVFTETIPGCSGDHPQVFRFTARRKS
jgi:hypothetical protein